MGILKDLFTGVGIPIDDFLCDTCHDVVEDPIGLDPCEHTFCKSCIGPVTWVQAECPVPGCGKQFTGQRKPPRPYLSLLSKLEVRCPYLVAISKGCAWKGNLGNLAGHQKACEYDLNNPIHRCIERCGAELVKGKEQDHQCAKYLKDELEKTRLALKKSELERDGLEGKVKTLEEKLGWTEEKLKATEDELKCKRKRVLNPNSWSSALEASKKGEEESSGPSRMTSPKLMLTRRSRSGKGNGQGASLDGYQDTQSPGYSQSPLVYGQSPLTPRGTNFNPQTRPGSGLDFYSQGHKLTTGIVVRVKKSHQDASFRRQIGVIRSVGPGSCAVFLIQDERTVNINTEYLSIELPSSGDRCKFICGEFHEQTGTVKSIDRKDAVVQMDSSQEFKFCPLNQLAKLW